MLKAYVVCNSFIHSAAFSFQTQISNYFHLYTLYTHVSCVYIWQICCLFVHTYVCGHVCVTATCWFSLCGSQPASQVFPFGLIIIPSPSPGWHLTSSSSSPPQCLWVVQIFISHPYIDICVKFTLFFQNASVPSPRHFWDVNVADMKSPNGCTSDSKYTKVWIDLPKHRTV